MKKTTLKILAIAIAVLILPAALALAAPVGKITALEGRVDITPAGAKDAVPVAVGTNVNAGDILRAKSKSKAEVTFTDGNMMRIAENTRIRITQYSTEAGQKSYFNLFRGKTQAVVDKIKKGSNFEVHTPTAICGVRGSIFVSMYINGQSSFVFSRGAGYGYNINQPDKIVTIPTKILMVVPRADKAPLLRPASDAEVDKHLKDTTPVEKPKEKEAAKEEKKPAGGEAQTAKQEGPKQEEAKKEEAKPADSPKEQQTAATTGEGGAPAPTSTATAAPGPTAPTAPLIDPTQIEQQLQQTQQTAQIMQAVQTQQTQQQQPIIEPPKDNTPPTINYTVTPAATTNEDTATFNYEANEKSDFQYRLDNSGWQNGAASTTTGSNSLSDLSEGNHTFEVKATDALGNTGTKAYTWTTDYSGATVPNQMTLTPKVARPVEGGKADVDYVIQPGNPANTHKYKVDSGSYQATGTTFTAAGLLPASHTIAAYERCQQTGLRGQDKTSTFTLSRYDYTGRTWLSGTDGADLVTEQVSGMIAGVSKETWGSWRTQNRQEPGMGVPAAEWTSYSGKANDAAGLTDSQIYYWLSRGSGTTNEAGGTISGNSSEMTYLTKNFLGTNNDQGVITGSYTESGWNFTDTGEGKYTETPLKFWGTVKQNEGNNFLTWDGTQKAMIKDGALTGMLGGTTDVWAMPASPAAFTGLGSYANPNSRTLYKSRFDQTSYSLSGGNFRGGLAGIIKPNNLLEAFGYAVYIKDPASAGTYETGYLKFSEVTGEKFPWIGSGETPTNTEGMWKQTGNITKSAKGTTAYAPDQIDANLVYDDTVRQRRIHGSGIAGGGMGGEPTEWTISGHTNNRSLYLQGQSWRIWHSESGGNFSETPGNTWTADYGGKDQSGGVDVNYEIGKVTGSIWSAEKIAGTVSGKHLGWQAMGTSSGQILGNVAGAGNWQAVGGGVSDSENLKFAALVGNWTSSSREGTALIYSRSAKPVETITINPSSNGFPIRFNVNWSNDSDFDSHTWIAPLANSSRYYHIYYSNLGLTGPNKFRYPYAYLDDDSIGSGQENIRYYMFQPGKTYYAIHRYSSYVQNPDVNTKIYDNDNNVIGNSSGYSRNFPDNKAYWSVFRIDSPLDPMATVYIYRYDTYGLSSPMELNSRVTNEGTIIGIMGGTNSVVQGGTTTDIPVRFMGSYTQATAYNRFWGQDLIAYKDSSSQYITIDGGTFFGALGGSFRPGEKRVQGVFHTFAVNSNGYAGLLRGSFGTGTTEGTDAGIVYPNIEMWEADGKVSRFDMNVSFGYSPGGLTGKWFAIAGDPGDPYGKDSWWGNNDYLYKGHVSTWNSNLGIYEGGWGMFLSYNGQTATYTQKAAMGDREDFLDIYKLKNDSANTFGVWNWRAIGKYNAPSDYSYPKWIMGGEFEHRDGNNEKKKIQLMAYGDSWSGNGSFTGRVIGHLGDGEEGFTGLAAGDTVGVYNDNPQDPAGASYEYNSFGAVSTGSWLNTTRFLEMMNDTSAGGGRDQLAALGYPTTETILTSASKNLTGDLASKAEKAFIINNMRIFAPSDHDLLKVFAATSAHTRDGQTVSLKAGSLYPVTGSNENLPIYGILQANYLNDSTTTWIGRLNVMGVFVKDNGEKIQGTMNGSVAGHYDAAQFSGTTSGTFLPANFLSQLTEGEKRAVLRYYNGAGSFVEDGYLKGLLGPENPVSWTQYSTYPNYTELTLTGVWALNPGETAVQRSHVFNFPVYPTNFTVEPGAGNRYTTTTGASFWGHLVGIHQVLSNGSTQDGMEAGIATVFVDSNNKAGFLFGKIGGPDAWNPTSYWGFDFNNQTFSIDTWQEKATLVQIGTTSVTNAAGLKTYLSSRTTAYTYLGGVIDPAVPAKIGAFYNGVGSSATGAIYMEKQDNPVSRTLTANYMDEGKWGVWSTDLYGTYVDPGTHDHWIGEIKTPEPAEGQAMPTKRMGAVIYGEPWKDNRIAGSTFGHWASVETALTGITFGKLLGTFDPNSYTYQATAAGGFLETAQYLSMTASQSGRETLRSINVPCVQVGSASMTGTTGDLTVNMNEMKFFAFSSGTAPHIWATNSVNGSFTSTHPLNTTVNMAGGGLTASFTVKNWDTANSNWMATVTNGSGSIGTAPNLQNLQFKGAAAGKIDTPTSFSGTAAGVVKQGAAN